MTKGFMIRELKKKNVRTGDKNGSRVKLEHLKATEVTKLYFKHFQ
jgi:hypothetical protein